jgi:antitoxin MazE
MRIRIQKWGNSLALRIPKAFAFQSNIREDEYVNVSLEENRIIVEPLAERQYSLKEMIEGINNKNLHTEIDTGHKVGNEVW